MNKNLIKEYISQYASTTNEAVDCLIENWERAKSSRIFSSIFRDELIIEKEIEFEIEAEELAVRFDKLYSDFMDSFYQTVISIDYEDQRFYFMELLNAETLINGRVPRTFEYTNPHTDKTFKVTKGQKIMKALKSAATFFGIPEWEFEDFRLAHSRILNDRKVKGTLCLSVHPMDYLTVSDNSNGWHSCLSLEHHGCHAAGVLELLNCPNTIVAYIKSSAQTMEFGDYEWNSKRWRQLVVMNDELLLGSKGYPFQSDKLNKIVLDWVSELSCIEYGDETYSYQTMTEMNKGGFYVSSDLLYCDFNAYNVDTFGRIAKNANISNLKRVAMGGQAYCLSCGQETVDRESYIICSCCAGEEWCSHCYEYVDCEMFQTHDGDTICVCCYENDYSYCDYCEKIFLVDQLQFMSDERYEELDEEQKEMYVGEYYCSCCL